MTRGATPAEAGLRAPTARAPERRPHGGGEPPAPHRRRRYWVNPPLQARFIAVLVGLETLALAVMAWAVFTVVWQPLLINLETAGSAPRPGLTATLERLTITTLAVCVGFAAVCAAVGLVVSHGVAGPLVRLKEAVRAAAETGCFEHRVRLRRGDCLADLADEVNMLLARLEERQDEQRELLARVASVVQSVTECLERGQPVTQEVLERTQELEGLMHRAALRQAPARPEPRRGAAACP